MRDADVSHIANVNANENGSCLIVRLKVTQQQ